MNQENTQIPPEEYDKPMSKGGDLPPLSLLPDREWLGARVVNVELRYSIFNGQMQYVSKTELDVESGQEVQVPIIDKDTGEKIPRKEFNIKFQLHNYSLPNNDPRCCWLTVGAAMGDKAHLPTLLFNVLGPDFNPETPKEVVTALTGKEVKLQLKNKPNKKDPTKPPYQNVIYDAVVALEKKEPTPAPEPINPEETTQDASGWE